MTARPNLIYRFSVILIKIPAPDLVDIDEMLLKFIQRGKIPRIKKSLKEEKKFGKLTLSDFKTY